MLILQIMDFKQLFLRLELVWHYYQPSPVRGWTSAFLLAVHRLCGVIKAQDGLAISQGKIPWYTPPWLGIESGPRRGQTARGELSHWAIITGLAQVIWNCVLHHDHHFQIWFCRLNVLFLWLNMTYHLNFHYKKTFYVLWANQVNIMEDPS